MYKFVLAALLPAAVLSGCAGDPEPSGAYLLTTPEGFPPVTYSVENNPVTPAGFELGRALFYDPILSRDSSVACANCHQQAVAFADPVHRLSKGVDERTGTRNAPSIQNMAFATTFFWDGGGVHLDFVPLNALTNELEMDDDLTHILAKLNRSTFYPAQFKRAFGNTEATSQHMLQALSQFMVMMVSDNSRYDQFVLGEKEMLTEAEQAGLKTFQQKCGSCHSSQLFTDDTYRNNGLDATFSKDAGRARITEFEGDSGKFKVPSLRNVALTAPYMHDGRFKTLEQVLEHYAHALTESETLDPLLADISSTGITMTDEEKQNIILFLQSLTDETFTHDKRFTNPF